MYILVKERKSVYFDKTERKLKREIKGILCIRGFTHFIIRNINYYTQANGVFDRQTCQIHVVNRKQFLVKKC